MIMVTSNRNTLLRVNLTNKTASIEPISPELASYVGGMGFGVKLLLDEVPSRVDALGPENKLIISVGPLTGTRAPMSAQTCMVTKSPLTGTILNTYAGGSIGPEIKQAGYDTLVFEGQAEEPVFVFIDGKEISFHPAADLRGLGTSETARQVKKAICLPEARVISIGLAGENRVRYASALAEHRVFGRGGAGAVMGSKNLKAIAVYGDRPVSVHNPEIFNAAVEAAMAIIRKELETPYALLSMFSRQGTGSGMGLVNERHALATRNHRYGFFPQANEIDATAYEKDYPTRPVACFGCPVHCGMLRKVPGGPLAGLFSRGPEYETMVSLGSNLLLGDREGLFRANDLCDQFGLDTLTMGSVLGMVLEAAENGLVKDGGDLRFGDPASILTLIEQTARREGIGDLLADGPELAARSLGDNVLEYTMQIKNAGYSAWMPRLMKGTGLSFITANRGACHKRAPIGAEIMGFIDGSTVENKAAIVKEIQDKVNAFFSLVTCRFAEFILPSEIFTQMLEGAAGVALSTQDFMSLGERIWTLERIFNVAEGFSRKEDWFPAREFEPVAGEAEQGNLLTPEEVNFMLDEYYALREWNKEGIPTDACLTRLNILEYRSRLPA
jgi:aldehyde:ferredoxin oxidoreductase